MKNSLSVILFLANVALPAAVHSASTPMAVHAGIDWFDGDVDAAFAQARLQNKPLFLYWGAAWCPPCNQVKAIIFKRADFIARSHFFVPMNLDGDSPGAQKLGARFKVRGYPTTILFRPDGSEITRLPGEVDAARYLSVLGLGMNATHPVKETLHTALTDRAKLRPDDWRLLSFYSWDTDEQALVEQSQHAATLQRLADNAPVGDAKIRLHLLAMVAAASLKPDGQPGIDIPMARANLLAVFGNRAQSRANADVLNNYASKLVEANSAPHSSRRTQLIAAGRTALAQLARDKTLSTTDQLAARDAEIALARLGNPNSPLDGSLLKAAQEQATAADHDTTDAYERQSVISAAGDVLTNAGLLDASDHLLNSELKRSQSPYYFMLGLAVNAKKRGNKTAALNWYEQAYAASKGPATRLQWGTAYLSNLMELTPADEPRIEQAAQNVFGELADMPDAFYERNELRLEKIAHALTNWKADRHQAAFGRMAAQLNSICSKLSGADPQRKICQALLVAG